MLLTTPVNENLDNVIETVKKIHEFNKQQKDKGLKLLTSKQMLQKITSSSCKKNFNTTENLLLEICQTIYSLLDSK